MPGVGLERFLWTDVLVNLLSVCVCVCVHACARICVCVGGGGDGGRCKHACMHAHVLWVKYTHMYINLNVCVCRRGGGGIQSFALRWFCV